MDKVTKNLRKNAFWGFFDDFSGASAAERLQSKFAHKPYRVEYAPVRFVALAASYLFNFFSAATAAALLYFFVNSIAGVYVAAICTGGAILVLESAKRFLGANLFKSFLQYGRLSAGLVGVVLLLLAISVAASFFGGKRAVHEFTRPVDVVSVDSATSQVAGLIAGIDAQIAELSQQKTPSGTIRWTAQKSISELTTQKSALMPELVRTRKTTDETNLDVVAEHKKNTGLAAHHFAIVTLFCELLFLLCAFYLEYYDWRSFVELHLESSNASKPLQTEGLGHSANGSFIMQPLVGGNGVQNVAGAAGENGIQNRVVIAGFQVSKPLRTEGLGDSANATFIMQPLADGEKQCLQCGKVYKYKVNWQKFCSSSCRDAHHTERHGRVFDPARFHQTKGMK